MIKPHIIYVNMARVNLKAISFINVVICLVP